MKNSQIKMVHILPAFYKKGQYDFRSIASKGGGERYASELALALSRTLETTLLTFGEDDYECTHEALKIKIIKCRPFLPFINGDADYVCLRLLWILREYAIIHAYNYFTDTTLFAVILAKFLHKKIFITDVGWRGLTISRYIPMKYFCNRTLILTEYEKYSLRLQPHQYRIIRGGVDLKKYTYLERKKKKVMFIGRILPHKGIDYLIDALDDSIECIIAGHKYNQEYFSLLEKKAAHKNITFLLSAPDEEIIGHLRESSALVLPSVDVDVYGKRHWNSELFGLVIAEAFACGTPVIVSNSSALPYVVEDGVDGFIVVQNDAAAIRGKIMFLLQNPQVVITMGRYGRIKAEKEYNWESVVNACLAEYSL